MFEREPGRLVRAARVAKQTDAIDAPRLQPVQPGTYFGQRVGMAVAVRRGAVVRAGAIIDAVAQRVRQRVDAGLGEQFGHCCDRIGVLVQQRAVGQQQRAVAERAPVGDAQRSVQRQAVILDLYLARFLRARAAI